MYGWFDLGVRQQGINLLRREVRNTDRLRLACCIGCLQSLPCDLDRCDILIHLVLDQSLRILRERFGIAFEILAGKWQMTE